MYKYYFYKSYDCLHCISKHTLAKMSCEYCKSNHPRHPIYSPNGENHFCNLCKGNDERILQQKLPIMFQVIREMELSVWLRNFTRSNNENWDEPNTNMGRFFADPRVDVQSFNGTDTKCLLLRLRWEAIQRGMI